MNTADLVWVGSPDAPWSLILAHGASGGMDSPFMTTFAEGLATRGERIGGLRVARFEFPYRKAQREDKPRPPDREAVLLATWRDVIAMVINTGCPRQRLLIGGKSLGGRMASLIADEQAVAGLLCLGYPFHPPGNPERLRTAHLQDLRTPTLICQGSRDSFGSRDEVSRYPLSPAIRIHWLQDGDHGFKPRKGSGRTEQENWDTAMEGVVGFIAGLV